jgi:glucosyl-3-phosphoglycerate synthase
MKMAIEITKILFRTLSAEGMVFRSLESAYIRTAEDTITRYNADAWIDGLKFDRHEEEAAVSAFAQAIRLAGDALWKIPWGSR